MSDDQVGIRFVNPDDLAPPVGYSHVAEVQRGRILYISGQVALDQDGNLVGKGDIEAQARQVFANLQTALAAMGADFNSVVKLNYYLVDMTAVGALRAIRDQYVNTEQPPASTAVEVRRLFREDILIEIEAVAVVAS
jgi:reactive intermediate/imine deaminase